MTDTIRTTVVLTKKAQAIKDHLSPALGVKGILSVGLEMFDKLSDAEKIRRVSQVISEDIIAKIHADVQGNGLGRRPKRGRPMSKSEQ